MNNIKGIAIIKFGLHNPNNYFHILCYHEVTACWMLRFFRRKTRSSATIQREGSFYELNKQSICSSANV